MLRCPVLNLEFGESYSECPGQLWYSGFSRPALIQLYSGLLCSDSVLKSTDKIIQIYTQVPQVPTSTCKYPKVPERYNFTWAQLWSDKTLLGTARPLSTVTTIQQQICTPRRQHLHFHPVKNYLLTMNMVRKYHHSAANLHTTPPPANLFISSFPSNKKFLFAHFIVNKYGEEIPPYSSKFNLFHIFISILSKKNNSAAKFAPPAASKPLHIFISIWNRRNSPFHKINNEQIL